MDLPFPSAGGAGSRNTRRRTGRGTPRPPLLLTGLSLVSASLANLAPPARAVTPLGLPGGSSGFTTVGPMAVPSPFGATSGYGAIPPALQFQDPSGNWVSISQSQLTQLNAATQQGLLDFLRPCSEDSAAALNGPPAVLDPLLPSRLTEVENGLITQGVSPVRSKTLIALLPKLQTPTGQADPLAFKNAIDAFNPIVTESTGPWLLQSPPFQQVYRLLAQISAALTGATPPAESCPPPVEPLPPPLPMPKAPPIRGL